MADASDDGPRISERKQREADALRANLQRRKAQARARRAGPGDDTVNEADVNAAERGRTGQADEKS